VDSIKETHSRRPAKGWRSKKVLVPLVILILACAGAGWYLMGRKTQPIDFLTAPVSRGEFVDTISATGTVEPEEVVDVGAQIAGQIVSFGKDAEGRTVDYGSVVNQGTVLARIDDSLYAADEARAQAALEAAQASLGRAEADLGQLNAKLRQAERDWQRARKLGPSEALSQAAYDGYQSAFESATANLAVGRAAVVQAKAEVAQARAALVRAKRSLSYCTIVSPVQGVIIDRRVNIGQTVVASLNAPSLFLIAKDLKRMQVWVAVNEADIGKIRPGQPVSFTVDAFPGETFQGQVGKVRLNAAMTQNVVTYTVEIITDNSSGRLLPYLSANVSFEVKRFKDVLLVPNAALRWRPPAALLAAAPKQAAPAAPAKAQGEAAVPAPANGAGMVRGRVWVLDDGRLKAVGVGVLASDVSNTAVRSRTLTPEMRVVVGLSGGQEKRGGSSNPFAPQFPGRSASRPR
jgi:HlyD family secretion protein